MRIFLLQLIFVLSWSSGFIGARLGTENESPLNLLFWRFLLVVICLMVVMRTRFQFMSIRNIRFHAVIGFLSQFLYLICVYTAIQHGLPAGIAAIMAALQPLITASISTYTDTEGSNIKEWGGLTLGFCGVGVVLSGQYFMSGSDTPIIMYFLPLISAVALSIATIVQRHQTLKSAGDDTSDPISSLFMQSSSSLVLFGLFGLLTGNLSVPHNPETWVSVVWLTLFSTFIAYLLLWKLLTEMSATGVASLVYLEPPVTLVWGAVMFGDHIYWTTWLGLAIIALAIWIRREGQVRRMG